MYRKFIFKTFGESITTKVDEYSKLYEPLELEKLDEIKLNKRSNPEKCCQYVCCWRSNKTEKINLQDDEYRKY